MANSITRQAIKDEVARRGWEFQLATDDATFFRVTDTSGRSLLGKGSRIGSDGNGIQIAIDKYQTYSFLEKLGYKLPAFMLSNDTNATNEFLRQYKIIAVKPADAEQSKGVTVGVTNEVELKDAIDTALTYSISGRVVLQQQLSGKLYRLLVVGDTLFAAAYRRAAFVTGDGMHTIRELIALKNQHPLRGDGNTPLKYISIDKAEAYIGSDAMEAVLDGGVEKELLAIASVSLGGEAEDVTEQVAQSTAELAIKITKDLGLSICGIDIICDDIGEAFPEGYLPILELNSMPGFKLHLFPTAGGRARDPAPAILDVVFKH